MKTIYCENLLLKNIELKQKDMYYKANQFGYTHPLVIACSKELDTLLNYYQDKKDTSEINLF